MRVLLNGEDHEFEPGARVPDAVAAAGARGEARGIAVAIDGEVVPRGVWEETELAEGQRIEVLQAVQGG